METWTVYEVQYEGGHRSGTRATRLPDKVVATGLHKSRADDLIRKAPGRRWACPSKKES